MNKFCHNCGKKAQEGDKFCTNCGTKLDLQGKSSSFAISSVMDEMERMMNEFLLRYKDSSFYDKLISNEYLGLSSCGMSLYLADAEVRQFQRELDVGLKNIQRLVEEINGTNVFVNRRNVCTVQNVLNKKALEIEKIKAKNCIIQEKIKKTNAKKRGYNRRDKKRKQS